MKCPEAFFAQQPRLGLEESSAGILEFDETASVGQTVTEHLGLEDTVLDIELTPNRGDCLSVLGVAREIAAIRGKPIRKANFSNRRAGHFEQNSIVRYGARRCTALCRPGYREIGRDPHDARLDEGTASAQRPAQSWVDC